MINGIFFIYKLSSTFSDRNIINIHFRINYLVITLFLITMVKDDLKINV